jgi:hypothetical protein
LIVGLPVDITLAASTAEELLASSPEDDAATEGLHDAETWPSETVKRRFVPTSRIESPESAN